MSRLPGYSLAAAIAVLLVPAADAQRASEPPLAAIIASGPRATAAALPDGSWNVELAALYAGDTDPAVSPDGARIAFVSARDGDEEIFVADARTGETKKLTRNERPDRRPAWSPDGGSIVWQRGPKDAADLHLMRADGVARRPLVAGPGDDTDPAWSPDGTRIAFSSTRGGRRQLWTVPATGGEPTVLALRVPGRPRAPAWSPGGQQLAFALETARGSDIWSLELANGSTRKLTRGATRDSRPDWSPGGKHIAFARVAHGRSSIWVVGISGNPATPVAGTDDLADPDWAQTDRALVPRPDERLPDLDQRAPAELVVVQARRRFHIGFASSTENRGLGPLMIRGYRLAGERTMRADQGVELEDGSVRIVRDIGRMHYERHDPHFHWHLKSFVTYQIHRADDYSVVATDGKSGFCLIDRWGRTLRRIPGTGPPRFVGDCGAGRPNARRVLEGTSVGYIDRYPAFFHGQELDLTPLPAGRYVLVHRTNSERTIRELRYSNDSASVLVRLAWPNGRKSAPRVTVLQKCDGSERCPAR